MTMTIQPTTAVRQLPKSAALADEIEQYIPGGVNSPFRSFKEVDGHTIFFRRGEGSYLFDVDGNSYIDYLGAWGPAILGHAHPRIVEVCQRAISLGTVFGAPHEFELELAKMLTSLVPSVQKVRFVNSGTEAVMSAVRLARGFTGRDQIVMVEGGYHGHSDSVLASQSHRNSAGIPPAVSKTTTQIPFNDLDALKRVLFAHAKETAAVLIEPVPGSMGVIPPETGYLQAVAEICKKQGVLLIFDEVLTGLRVAAGGAQTLYEVTPDLTCFGKALGGGMPIGAYGGRADIMDHLEPRGKVYQAGTFSGNPITMAAALATLKLLSDQSIYTRLEDRTAQLFEGLSWTIVSRNLPVQLQRVGSMFSILFAPHPVTNYKESTYIDAEAFARFFNFIVQRGIYFPPSSVDAACVSSAHSQADIEETVKVCSEGLVHAVE